MDQNQDLNPINPEASDQLVLDDLGRNYLYQGAKWARFLAIIGFIGIGLVVLMGLMMGTVFGAMNDTYGMSGASALAGPFATILYLIIGALYFVPTLYLFRFAKYSMEAIERKDQMSLNEGLKNQTSLFKFMGILTIIFLGLYALVILGGIFVAMAAA